LAKLYVVGTPIGNLEDISQRALETLRRVSLIAAENPARTQRLLARYEVSTPMMRYTDAYDRKKRARTQAVLTALEDGDVALVSEAGMPGLADPGYELLQAAIEQGVPVVAVPGPTAVTAALSVSGLVGQRYVFVGFLPRKRAARRTLLSSVADAPYPVVAYESPHRLVEALRDIEATLGDRRMSISCELTKLYEETQHGTASEMVVHFQAHAPRGEFTLVIASKKNSAVRCGTFSRESPTSATITEGGDHDPATQ
jgi:16S rRNA (cytidine1402-2'-O)-methyltransferase